MSTILDALRKLQREPAQDLPESVAIDAPFSRAERPRWPVIALLVLLLAGAGAGAYYVWMGAPGIEQASLTDPPAERAAALAQREAASPVAPGPEPSRVEQPSARQRKALALARARQRSGRVAQGRAPKAPPAEPEPSPARSASNPTTAEAPAAGAHQVAAAQSPVVSCSSCTLPSAWASPPKIAS